MFRRWLRPLVVVAALALLAPIGANAASDPPLPTELRLYGSVQVGEANLDPAGQTVFALVNGRVCGSADTFLNPPNEPVDGGMTVYVIEVTATGTRANEVEGCGAPGDSVAIYFPDMGHVSPGSVTFATGAARFDISLPSGPLPGRLYLPLISNDAPR